MLRTIGYQESTQDAVIGTLATAGVRLLVDVRAIAASRRPGFSKRQLMAGLAQHDIGYLHLQKLGTPKEGRLAVRAGRPDEMRRIFEAHLETEAAKADLAELAAIAARGTPLCLLCFERHHEHCHRTVIAERLGGAVEHLRP